MSELSRRSGVTVATIKYYLREGLLPPGEATGATRARYDDAHVQRLRLIRALVDVAGMRLDRVRAVLAAVDDTTAGPHEMIAAAHEQLSPEPDPPPSAGSRHRVEELIRELGWRVTPDGRHSRALAAAVDRLAEAGQPLPPEALATYAEAAHLIAAREIDSMPDGGREELVAYAVTGTLLVEPVLLTLRRLAQENLSTRRYDAS